MSKKDDYNDFQKRDTLSLFGDETRSRCTVAEAKAFDKAQAAGRRRLMLCIVIPLLVVVAIGGFFVVRSLRAAAEAARLEEERQEAEASKTQVTVIGLDSARMKIAVQGPSEEALPPQYLYVAHTAQWWKPSEVQLTISLNATPGKMLPFACTINGQESLECKAEDGSVTAVSLKDRSLDAELLAKAVSQAWNALYPEAQHPLSVTIPQPKKDKFQLEEERNREKFENIPSLSDPRMVNPTRG